MEKEFVPYSIALALKKKGFDEPCLAKWIIEFKGATVPRFLYNYQEEGRWFKHNSKKISDLNGNDGKEFVWSAPMWQQVIGWLRDTHEIDFYVTTYSNHMREKTSIITGRYNIVCCSEKWNPTIPSSGFFSNNYYEALSKAIEEAIKLITV